MPTTDFHHASLALQERLGKFSNSLPQIRTWYVKTANWEQQACSSNELVDLIDEALDAGLVPSVELC